MKKRTNVSRLLRLSDYTKPKAEVFDRHIVYQYYKELFSYFDGECNLEESLELIKKKSRNYAKRQYTWFNNQFNVKWFNVNLSNFKETIANVIGYLEDLK